MVASIIVPAYNAEKTIDRCISALLDQTIPPEDYEVIVVDDGSTDNTAEIIKNYPVRYYYQKNSGPAAARNKGVYKSKSEIILFTDADCVPSENWIKEMVKPLKSTETAAVKGAYKTNQKEIVARFAQVEFLERFKLLEKAETIDMIDTYSAAFKKNIFLQAGGFDLSFPVANNEDTELSYKLSKQGCKMVFNPEAVVFHLNHPDSIKRYARLKFWRGYWRMVVYKMYPDKMLKDSYTPQSLKFQVLIFYGLIASLPALPVFSLLAAWAFLILVLIFLFSTVKFVLIAKKEDIEVAVLSPLFLFVRAGAIGSGALWGTLTTKFAKRKDKDNSKNG